LQLLSSHERRAGGGRTAYLIVSESSLSPFCGADRINTPSMDNHRDSRLKGAGIIEADEIRALRNPV
jgi:hypothetical protein